MNKQQVSNIDLDLNNYSLQDLLGLFNLPSNASLDETNMKLAKHKVHIMHPDKSKLDPKYFVFFKNAYEFLVHVANFQNKTSDANRHTNAYEYAPENTKSSSSSSSSSTNKFNREEFNRLFEQMKPSTMDRPGYGDWFSSEEDLIYSSAPIKKSLAEAQREIDAIKEKQSRMVMTVHREVEPFFIGGSIGSYLSDSGSLRKMGIDLKEAYSNTLIHGTNGELNDRKQYKNVEEYARARAAHDTTPISEREARIYFQNKERQAEEDSQRLGFRLAKEMEMNAANQNKLQAQFRRLQN